MSKRLRPTLEDLVLQGKSYVVFDKNLAFEFLKRVDAQDAMSFAQTFGADNRYQSFVKVLREDRIWKFWMEQDLDVLKTTPGGTFKALLWEIPKEKRVSTEPIYKIYYLWYRLMISAHQYNILSALESNSGRYGMPTRFNFIRLNEFEERKVANNNSVLYDFRKEFKRLITDIPIMIVSTYNLRRSSYMTRRPFEVFLQERYPKFAQAELEATAQVCLEIFNGMRLAKTQSVDSGLNPLQLDMLYTIPRVKGPSYVLVASAFAPCLQCGLETKFSEKTNTERFFCDAKCQNEFY